MRLSTEVVIVTGIPLYPRWRCPTRAGRRILFACLLSFRLSVLSFSCDQVYLLVYSLKLFIPIVKVMQAPPKFIAHEVAEFADQLATLFELGGKNVTITSKPEIAKVRQVQEAYDAEKIKGDKASPLLLRCLHHKVFQVFLEHWETAFQAHLDWLIRQGRLPAEIGALRFQAILLLQAERLCFLFGPKSQLRQRRTPST